MSLLGLTFATTAPARLTGGPKTIELPSSHINAPFVVALSIAGFVLAVLIVANLISAALVASYRRIGVMKSIGFIPAQVAACYLIQTGTPAVAAVIAGTVL